MPAVLMAKQISASKKHGELPIWSDVVEYLRHLPPSLSVHYQYCPYEIAGTIILAVIVEGSDGSQQMFPDPSELIVAYTELAELEARMERDAEATIEPEPSPPVENEQEDDPELVYAARPRRRRDSSVVQEAKRRANGICQLCGKPAPFLTPSGEPYLETHHIVWLSEGGEDTVKNTAALCPNCHRRIHILKDRADTADLGGVL